MTLEIDQTEYQNGINEMMDKEDGERSFIASHFNMSLEESQLWINNHTQEEIDNIFNKYIEE